MLNESVPCDEDGTTVLVSADVTLEDVITDISDTALLVFSLVVTVKVVKEGMGVVGKLIVLPLFIVLSRLVDTIVLGIVEPIVLWSVIVISRIVFCEEDDNVGVEEAVDPVPVIPILLLSETDVGPVVLKVLLVSQEFEEASTVVLSCVELSV